MLRNVVKLRRQRRGAGRRGDRGNNPRQANIKNSTRFPPSFNPTFQIDHVFRFTASGGAVDADILYSDLQSLWVVATSATVATVLAKTVRLRKVEVWGPMPSTLIPVTVSVAFGDTGAAGTAGASGPVKLFSDTSMGATQPAHVSCRPPLTSQISQWQDGAASGSAQAFRLVCPQYAIIDVHLSYLIADKNGYVPGTVSGSGMTTGANYEFYLDASSTQHLVPVSYPLA